MPNSEQLISKPLQLFAALVLAAFLAVVLRLIRAGRLSLRDSLSWFLSTAAALVASVAPQGLRRVAEVLGFQLPANALFVIAFLYVMVNLLALTVTGSGNASRLRRLTQECALLRARLGELERQCHAGSSPESAGGDARGTDL